MNKNYMSKRKLDHGPQKKRSTTTEKTKVEKRPMMTKTRRERPVSPAKRKADQLINMIKQR